MKTQKIALFTSTGNVGHSIAEEAVNRGHSVTVIIGDSKEFNFNHLNLIVIKGDVNSREEVSRCAKYHDIIIFDQELKQNREGECYNATRSVIMGCVDTGIDRLIVSGRVHSINQDLSKEQLTAWRPVQEEQLAALELLEKQVDISWSYFYTMETDLAKKSNISIRGNNFIIITPNKENRISMEEYAKTIIDDVEKNENIQTKFREYLGTNKSNNLAYKENRSSI